MQRQKKSNTHKRQHFVAQCYLKAWLDPESKGKPNLKPYVWVFDKDGSNARKKSPSNLFTEQDIYTIQRDNGQRDLRLEHGFQQLEDKFTRIRNTALSLRKWPTTEQMAWILAFVATAQIRTQANRDHQREQWGNIRKRMEEFEIAFNTANLQRKKSYASMASPHSGENQSGMTLGQVKQIEERPIQGMIGPLVSSILRHFSKMHVAILCGDVGYGFISSDKPCTWFEPNAYKLSPIYRGVGLASPEIEITLPISPSQCLVITHNPELRGFINVGQNIIDVLNHRHIGHCNNSFISCTSDTRPNWFEKYEMPDDAWEKVREQKIASGEWSQ